MLNQLKKLRIVCYYWWGQCPNIWSLQLH